MTEIWNRPNDALSGKIFLPSEELEYGCTDWDVITSALMNFLSLMRGRERETSYRLPESAVFATAILDYQFFAGENGHVFFFETTREEPEKWLQVARGLQSLAADNYLTNFRKAVDLATTVFEAQENEEYADEDATFEAMTAKMEPLDERFNELNFQNNLVQQLVRWIVTRPEVVAVPRAQLPFLLDRLAGLQYSR